MLEKHANCTLLSHEHMFYQAKMCGTNQIPWVIQVNAYLLFRWNLLQAQCKFCASCAAHSPTWPQTKQSWITVTSKCGVQLSGLSPSQLSISCWTCWSQLLFWSELKPVQSTSYKWTTVVPVWVKGVCSDLIEQHTEHSYLRWHHTAQLLQMAMLP